jgi:hypothetical protein
VSNTPTTATSPALGGAVRSPATWPEEPKLEQPVPADDGMIRG